VPAKKTGKNIKREVHSCNWNIPERIKERNASWLWDLYVGKKYHTCV
jgi:hypothetical protein